MVFHEVESLTEVLSGHRIIIYYIEDGIENKEKLRKSVESVMDMLGKKNDDLIVFRVHQNTHQFSQFKELYKPEIKSPIALFVINNEGIPLICEEIHKEDNIAQALESICAHCKLNTISKGEIFKAVNYEAENISGKTSTNSLLNGLQSGPAHQGSQVGLSTSSENDVSVLDSGSDMKKDNLESVQSLSTVLQIRLPDGTKEKQKFDKDAYLQEVYDFVRTKFNLKDFDLKTYNRNVFLADDYEKTLQDLDLTPNGVVIVVYKNLVAFNGTSSLSRKFQYGFWILFGKVTPIFQYVQNLLLGFWNSFFSSGNVNSRRIQNQAGGSHSQDKKSGSSGAKKPSGARFGNIHTLRRSDDSDDENNRYNGNSTQQK